MLRVDESHKVHALRAAVQNEPNATWADLPTCARYLRARDQNLQKATAMLRATLKWRRDFGVQHIDKKWKAITKCGATGKVRVSDSRDRVGRPVLVLTPALENTKNDHDGNITNLVYHLERLHGGRATTNAYKPSPDGKAIVIVDFRGWSLFGNHPPLKTSRATLNVLQDHYPETLHCFVALHAPALFYGAYNTIKPFIDPVTRAKIRFVHGASFLKELEAIFDLSQLEVHFGGELATEWDADAYFAADLRHSRMLSE